MIITKCDVCKKTIKDRKNGKPARVHVGFGYWANNVLCEKCGAPILAFMKKNKLLETSERSK